MSNHLITSAWKCVDDALKLLERMAGVLKPLHRDSEVAGIGRTLRIRRQQPLFVLQANPADALGEMAIVELPGAPGDVKARQLRPGVLVLDNVPDLGLRRHFCDVGRRDAADLRAPQGATMPLLLDALPDSSLDAGLAAFGAARQAWFSIDELQRIVIRELEALDRLIEKLKIPPPSAGGATAGHGYFARLGALVAELQEEERERSRDRETLQRNFLLVVRSIVTAQVTPGSVIQEIKPTAVDRFRPPGMRHVIGKTHVDVRLGNDAINQLVADIDREACRAAEDRIHGMARSIEKLSAGQFARYFGAGAEQWLHPVERKTRPTTHPTIAVAGAGFQFKLERLGVVNRLMRARMEIAGLLMLVFLALSVFSREDQAERRAWIGAVTLAVAVLITVVSYFTSGILEEERLEEEVEQLRDQLTKSGMEAAARLYGDLLSGAVARLAELGEEAKARQGAPIAGRPARTSAVGPAIVPFLTGLRADLARELGGTGGPGAVKQQLEQLIGSGGTLRTALR